MDFNDFDERRKELEQAINTTYRNADNYEIELLCLNLSILLFNFGGNNQNIDPERRTPEWFMASVAMSHDDPGKVSYAGSHIGMYDNNRRRKASLHKFLSHSTHKFGWTLTEEQIQMLATYLGPHLEPVDYGFELVHGDDVVKGYNEKHFGSCMSEHSEYYRGQTQFYAENPDAVGLLRCTNSKTGELLGRALVWHTDQGKNFMDRIYPSDGGKHHTAMIEYAKSQEWDHREGYRHGGIASDTKYTVAVKDSGNYPYMDTFTSCDRPSMGKFKLYTHGKGQHSTMMTDDTCWWEQNIHECANCGDREHEDDLFRDVEGEWICDYCRSEYYVDARPGHGNYYHVDRIGSDVFWIENRQEYWGQWDTFVCAVDGQRYHTSDRESWGEHIIARFNLAEAQAKWPDAEEELKKKKEEVAKRRAKGLGGVSLYSGSTSGTAATFTINWDASQFRWINTNEGGG